MCDEREQSCGDLFCIPSYDPVGFTGVWPATVRCVVGGKAAEINGRWWWSCRLLDVGRADCKRCWGFESSGYVFWESAVSVKGETLALAGLRHFGMCLRWWDVVEADSLVGILESARVTGVGCAGLFEVARLSLILLVTQNCDRWWVGRCWFEDLVWQDIYIQDLEEGRSAPGNRVEL